MEAKQDLMEAARDALALLVNGPDGCDDDPERVVQALRRATDTPNDATGKAWISEIKKA